MSYCHVERNISGKRSNAFFIAITSITNYKSKEYFEQAVLFERRYHISAEDESNGRGDSTNTSQVC
jgi:hypothetical protein